MSSLALPSASDAAMADRPALTLADAPHLPGLDGLRAIAVLLVIPHNLLVAEQPASGWMHPLLSWLERGWIGVTLFFALSGFLITGILLDTARCENRLRVFYARRALRIFPLYYTVLILMLLVAPALHWPPRPPQESTQLWWAYWVYLTNWATGFHSPMPSLPHVWSLAVEEQFYLVWPLLVYGLRQRHVCSLGLALFGASLGVRIAMVMAGQAPDVIYTNTFARMDALALGAVCATALRDPALAARLPQRSGSWLLVAGGALAAAALTTQLHAFGPWQQTVGYSLLAIACATLVAGVALGDSLREGGAVLRRLRSAPLRRIGLYSYGMYMVHVPLAALVGHPLLHHLGYRVQATDPGRWLTGWPLVAYLLAGTVLSFLVAMASWHGLEQWFLRHKPAYRRAPADQSPSR